MINKRWINLSLFYFLSIAIIGCLIRFGFFSGNFITQYKYLLHTHSHIAFLGWIYPSLFILITNNFINEENILKNKYKLQFYITQILIIFMFFSFLKQGYGFFSILFSSLFQLMTYWFTFSFFKDSKRQGLLEKNSVKFIRIGLLSLVISSIGTWSLPIIVAKHLNETNWYNSAIYFYLHFQYNGWFLFSLLGLFLGVLEKEFQNRELNINSESNSTLKFNSNVLNENEFKTSYGVSTPQEEGSGGSAPVTLETLEQSSEVFSNNNKTKKLKNSLFYLALALVPSYFLSIIGLINNDIIKIIAFIGSIFEIIGLFYFFNNIIENKNIVSNLTKSFLDKIILFVPLIALGIKIMLQFLSNLNYFHELAFTNRFIVLSYLHLTLIGFTSLLLIFLLKKEGYLYLDTKLANSSIIILLFGFTFSEGILSLVGLSIYIPNALFLILIFSLLMALGILGIFINNLIFNKK
ncbi:MAG: hypothetical protein U0457_05850 [Candidatus Sericytochromatia bacterium]